MKKTTKLLLVLSLATLFALSALAFVACKKTVDPKLDVTVASSTDVKVGDSLDSVKQYLTVKYTDSDNKTSTVTNYELQGALTEGQTTLTVRFKGLVATCKIMVNAKQDGDGNSVQEDNNNPSPKPVVTAELDGGTLNGEFIINEDNTLTPPDDPIRTGYAFNGWYKNSARTALWLFATDKVTGNVTLYADWTEIIPVTNGLEFRLNSDEQSYYVADIGSVRSTKINIPSEYNGLPVTGIGVSAFSGQTRLTNVVMPESITTIGPDAFYYCINLTSVNIPNAVKTIADSAFGECHKLTKITVPDSVTTLGPSVFYNCKGLTSVTISESITEIREMTFYGCDSLTSVVIPDKVWSIDYNAFYECKNLKNLTLGIELRTLGGGSFEGCIRLTNIEFKGTKKQWNTVQKIYGWNTNISATKVSCSDGEVAL